MAGIATTFINTSDSRTAMLDLVRGVIENFDKDKVSQTQLLTEHAFLRRMMGEKAKTVGGGAHRTDLRMRDKTGFKFTNLLEARSPTRQDLMVKLVSEPKHSDDSFFFDIREDAYTSDDMTRVYDGLEQQYNGMKVAFWDAWEAALVGMPTNPASVEEPFGVVAFLRGLATGEEDSDGSFNGVYAYYDDGTAVSNIGGEDAATADNSRLRSYAATDEGGFHAGTIATITRAKLRTKFNFVPGLKSAVTGAMEGGNWMPLSTSRYNAAIEYADKVIAGGPDAMLAPQYNEIMVRGSVLVHAPSLDALADDPILGINGSELYGIKLRKFWMRALGPAMHGGSMLQMQVGMASSGALHCRNPRSAGFRIGRKRVA